MTLYQKVLAVFSLLRNSISGKVDNSEFAPSFSTSTQYAAGTLVMKDGVLYACTSAHLGEWDPGHFLRTVMSLNIPTKTSDLSNDSGFIGGSAIAQSLDGIAVKDDATQKEVRVAVQGIIAALKSLGQVSCIALALLSASAAEALNDGTLWEDVSPTNKVKDVVENFSPPADFSPGNTQLVNTIRSESMTTNSQSFLVGLMNNMATSVYDSGTIVLKDHEINCVTRPDNVSFELPPRVPGRSCSFGIFMAHSPQNTFTFPTNGVAYLNPGMIWPFEPPSGDYLRYSFAMFYEIYCPDLETRSFVLLGGECYRVSVSEGQGR